MRYEGNGRDKPSQRKGRRHRKKVRIAWEIYKTGELTYSPRHANKKVFVGDPKSPIAAGLKKDLWANLDDEFFLILEKWRWIRAGFIKPDLGQFPYHIARGIRYLIEEDYVSSRVF